MTGFLSDLRLAARDLARRRLSAALAASTFALGIGAVAATYSVVDTVLLRPLPYREPERLVALWSTTTGPDAGAWRVTGAVFTAWGREARVFESLSAFSAYGATLTGRGEPVALRGGAVTPEYFETLGVRAEAGTLLGAAKPGDGVAVVSRRLAETRLGGVAAAIGATLTLDGEPFVVVGVAPTRLYPTWPVNGPRMHFRADSGDVFVPIRAQTLRYTNAHVLGVVGRLAPGVALEAARESMSALESRLSAARVDAKKEGVVLEPLLDEAVGGARAALFLVLGAAALVLLIACANVGALLVGRASERRNEIAVRRALGADTHVLARRALADGLVIAVLGGGAGSLLAAAFLPALRRLVPQEIPRLAAASVDLRVLLAVAGVAAASSVCFALLPLLASRGVGVVDALKDGGRAAGAGAPRQRLRALLVAGQVALAVALTIGAGLLAEAFRRIVSVETGVALDGVLVVDVDLDAPRYAERASVERFEDALRAALRPLPGVVSVAFAYDHPLESNWVNSFTLPGRTASRTGLSSDLRFVTPGYFRGLGIEVGSGREFEETDRAGRPGVAVVDEEFVRRFLSGADPIGAVVDTEVGTWAWGDAVPKSFRIAGVVATVVPPEPGRVPQPTLYLPLTQVPMKNVKLLVRRAGDPLALVGAVRAELTRLDPDLPVAKVRTLEGERRRAVAQPRFNLELMGLFGVLALALSAVGVYGVVSAWVASRTREIGVRMALGARPLDVLTLVATRGARPALFGVAAGSLVAAAGARLLASQLHGASPAAPAAWLAAPAVVLASAALASLAPALRASRTPPAAALHTE